MKLIKLAVISATMTVAFMSTASATPLCVSGGSLASYQALGVGGCTIGNALFANFVYGSSSAGTGVDVANTAIFLTPVNSNTYSPGPGILFSSAGWIVPSASPSVNSLVDSSIGFTVTVLDNSSLIEDGTLILSSYSQAGTGVVDITETINPSGVQMQVGSDGQSSSHVEFAQVKTVSVLKDILVSVPKSANPNAGFAQLNSFEEDFSEAPEPVSSVLFGTGLLAVSFWRRRAARN